MKSGMNLQELLTEVIRQEETKRDFIVNTHVVQMQEIEGDLAIVFQDRPMGDLQRFPVSENAHRQIATRLNVPWKYYTRLLTDHRDLVVANVNTLFEREPEMRMVRVLDGKVRAFLSNQYRRLDNAELLQQVLPPVVEGTTPSALLSSWVGDDKMHLKVVFTDNSLARDLSDRHAEPITHEIVGVGDARPHSFQGNAEGRDIIRPGIVISNSETGHGSMTIRGFFYREFCYNGCVLGEETAFEAKRTHVGKRISEMGEIFSDETKRQEDRVIMSQMTDSLFAMTDSKRIDAVANRLRAIRNGTQIQDAFATVEKVSELLSTTESESKGILESLIKDRDYSQWGMVNAVTEQANRDDISYARACEFEEMGAQIIKLSADAWTRLAVPEAIAA